MTSTTPNANAFLRFYSPEPPRNLTGKTRERYIKKRAFYSCNDKNYTYIDYVHTGTKPKDYIDYAGNEEKSEGLFSLNGKMRDKERRELKQQLRKTESVIWDLVISFKPGYGQKYCSDSESAQNIMKSVLPRFLKRAGFNPDNITLYWGLHTNRRHRHIHISFFEKEPKRYRANDNALHYSEGFIPKACLEYLKIITEQKASDISAQLKALRAELTRAHSQAINGQLGRTRNQTLFRQGLAELMFDLPKSGRLGYDSDNMACVRPKVDKLTECAIKGDKKAFETFNALSSALQKRDNETREMLKRNKVDPRFWCQYMVSEKYISDIYRRLGNQVINAVRVFKKDEISARSHLARKRIEHAREERLLDYSIRLQTSLESDAILTFNEYMRELERNREIIYEKD